MLFERTPLAAEVQRGCSHRALRSHLLINIEIGKGRPSR